MEQGELTLLCVVEQKTEESLPVVQVGMGAIATSYLKLLLGHDSKFRTVYTVQIRARCLKECRHMRGRRSHPGTRRYVPSGAQLPISQICNSSTVHTPKSFVPPPGVRGNAAKEKGMRSAAPAPRQ